MGAGMLIQSLLKTTWFAGNPFLAALLVGALARWGRQVPQFMETALAGGVSDAAQLSSIRSVSAMIAGSGILNVQAPWWMVHSWVLVGLGVLAVVRGAALKREQEFVKMDAQANNVIAPVLDGAMTFGLVDAQSANILHFFVGGPIPHGGLTIGAIWFSAPAAASTLTVALAIGAAIFSGGLTWLQVQIRNGLLSAITAVDVGGHLGLTRLFRWVESGTAAFGLVLVVVLPLLALGLALLTVAALIGLRVYFRRREQQMRVPCPTCAVPMHRSAIACASCRTANPHPLQVGQFGQAIERPAEDLSVQRVMLLSRHRCPSCATLLTQPGINVVCEACGTEPFADIAAVNTYLRSLDARQPKTLGLCLLFGFIPVLGIVPAMITYQLSLGASLSGYIPRATGCATRWGMRLLTLVLLPWQVTPVFGALVVPAIAWINYRVSRQVLVSGALGKLPNPAAPLPMVAIGAGGVAVAAPSMIAPAAPALAATPNRAAPLVLPLAESICSSCQTAVRSGDTFCGTCGNRLTDV